MASLLNIDRVQYVIDNEKQEMNSLARLYFCIYCKSMKSTDTLQLEIDCHFCPLTLDGLPSGEAAGKKNRSPTAWQCPSCTHPSLSTKSTNLTVPSADDPTKPTVKKSYYQTCNFCRWSSRSVGIRDKDIVSGAWSERSNPQQQSRIQNLREYYKFLSSKEIAEGEQKKTQKKKGYFTLAMQMQQKYGSSRTSQARKQAALASSLSAIRIKETLKEVSIAPSETCDLDSVEKLPDYIYDEPVDFTQVSSVKQRIEHPSYQPKTVAEFRPRKSTMYVKRSLRCKICDHNIIKPEYNTSSIRFKINVSAILHVPEIRINKLPPLAPGKTTSVVLSIINPTERVLRVSLLPNEAKKKDVCNTEVRLPSSDLILAKFDETAEYSDVQDDASEIAKDDPDVIAFRSANKLGFYVDVIPDSSLTTADDMWMTFSFKYDHIGTVPVVQMFKTAETEKKPETVSLTQTVYINLGKLQDFEVTE